MNSFKFISNSKRLLTKQEGARAPNSLFILCDVRTTVKFHSYEFHIQGSLRTDVMNITASIFVFSTRLNIPTS